MICSALDNRNPHRRCPGEALRDYASPLGTLRSNVLIWDGLWLRLRARVLYGGFRCPHCQRWILYVDGL